MGEPGRRGSTGVWGGGAGSAFVSARGGVGSVGVLDEFEFEVDLDLVGDDGVTGAERGVEGNAVGLAADRGGRGEPCAGGAVGVDSLAEEFHGQLDRLGGAA